MEILLEEWRSVVGREGQNEVSNLGRVRELARVVTRAGKPMRRPERLLSTKPGKNGYPATRVGNVLRYVHHMVLEAFVGPRPEGMEGCHGPDPTRTNCRLDNLRWDTPQANQTDRVKDGTSNRGERCAAAKLTEYQAREIMASTEPGCELARRYGVAQQTICSIRKGRNWNHLRHLN